MAKQPNNAKTAAEETTTAAPPTPEEIDALLSGKGYGEVEDVPIISWEDAQGRVVEGKVHRIREAGKGKVLDLDVEGEVVTYGLPRVLERKLDAIPDVIGRTVALVCLGKTLDTPNGRAWNFRVFVRGLGARAKNEELPF